MTRIRTLLMYNESCWGGAFDQMYVCNCNGITEKNVQQAVKAGAATWKEVHHHFGYEPCCGRCQIEIMTTLEANDSAEKGTNTDNYPESAILGAI